MKMDTVAALGLLGKLTRSSVTVNTASRQNMGVAGDLQVNFKIGRKYSFTQMFVVCENLTRPFILGADFMSKHYMKLGWAPGKKRTLGYLDKTIAVAFCRWVQALYKQLSHQKHHSEPCFWRSQPCCPLLRFISRTTT